MAFASCARLLPSSPSTPALVRARAGAVSFLAPPPSPSAAARSSRNLALFCSSSTPSPTEAAVAPPPPQAAVEETKPPAPGGDEKAEPTVEELAGLLDIRVGRVVKAWRHPEADTLYVEEVDVGEAEPRTICSGLVNFLPIEELQDSSVIVLANLKPRNMRGIKSNGMLMAASDASHENVELLNPPEGSVPGERVWFGSEEEKDRQSDPASPNQVQKKKIWEFVQPHLKTTDNCVAVLSEHTMRTSAGPVLCKSLKGARVS
ncbi:multisynthetase complex auxiliary component p43 [Panicum miliaceum]|uniref:Multisynthetase complex auxiliary component p43 n=1 Tax=Panicum miliaceum TaxID=4540 RepID=A0A3L6Q3P4_PANMI|nr:multisynthetase complex auxiliary component p43 [Panicum miliaceum]